MRHINAPDVGAPDPELENSPVADLDTDELEFTDLETVSDVCFFNGIRYPIGDYVCSGGQLLLCEKGGVWVPKGSCYE